MLLCLCLNKIYTFFYDSTSLSLIVFKIEKDEKRHNFVNANVNFINKHNYLQECCIER